MSNVSLSQQLDGVQKLEKKVQLQKYALVNKAMQSTDPAALVKAAQIIEGIEPREQSPRKSLILDPTDFNNQGGYRTKPLSLTYGTLRRISYCVPVIRAIINTRINQISSFCQPQTNKYSTGFIVRKKRLYFDPDAGKQKMSRAELIRINEITEMLLNCGGDHSFNEEDFDEFTRKVWNDSLTFDQLNWENVYKNNGDFHSFASADASTMRVADSYNNEEYERRGGPKAVATNVWHGYGGAGAFSPVRQKVLGHYPSYCQVINDSVVADFYPWELCWGVRNPSSSIYAYNYGISEIEILINTITSLLWGDEYNRRFFSQGSAPKGFLKIKNGFGANTDRLAAFKREWSAMMSGVYNAWKTPIFEADVEWEDLHVNNRDMEYSQWIEFLIKVACAVFSIDPAEINFPLSGGAEQKAMFEGNNEARLQHSRDKGLRPMVKFYERKLNKYIVSRIDPAYELVFMGLDDDDPTADLERDVKMVSNFSTVDEIRAKNGDKPLGPEKGGDLVLNAIWYQNYMMGKQADLMDKYGAIDPAGQRQNDEEAQQNAEQQGGEFDNPIQKALESYLQTL